MRRPRTGWAVAWLLGLVACADSRAPTDAVAPERALEAGAGRQGGVLVPLPPGWEARPAAEGELRVGPVGSSVLRIAARPEASALLPSVKALRELLPPALRPSARAVRDSGQTRIVTFRMAGDGGSAGVGFIGAARVGERLFLCAGDDSLREEELEDAIRACAGLQVNRG